MNENIRAPELRVIVDGEGHLGTMPRDEALAMARERELDLVVIQPKTEPPIAKIIDFGKFKYEKDKQTRQQKAKQKTVEVKGVRLSVRIGTHDLSVRKEQAKKHLEKGDKIKVEIILRGRERRHGDLARQVIENFVASLNEDIPVKTEQPATRQGGQLTCIIAKA